MSDYDTIFFYYITLQYSFNDSSIVCYASGSVLITTTSPLHDYNHNYTLHTTTRLHNAPLLPSESPKANPTSE